MKRRPVVLVSACLTGIKCRYDGETKRAENLAALLAGYRAVPVCPEELGGLGTPRPPAQLAGGDGAAVSRGDARVLRVDDGVDVTEEFLLGAERALAAAPEAQRAILKARSPSCGCGRTWIDGEVRDGDGVFAAMLRSRGVLLLTEEDG